MNSREEIVYPLLDLLLVDGSERIRRTLTTAMQKYGYNVTACRNAGEAMQAAIDCRPLHIVTELKLPDGSGLKLLSQLKLQMPDAKVVVLTGYASIASAVEAIKRGATHYLIKPVNAEQLVAALNGDKGGENAPVYAKALSIRRLEWEYLHWVLEENDGNLSAAARTLSMHRRTLQRKLSKRAPKG